VNTLVSGPLEKVDVSSGRVVVLGQSFKAEVGAEALKNLANRVASGSTVSVSVLGMKDSAGKMRPKQLVLSRAQYVPGATKVVVVGQIAAVQSGVGTFGVGQLVVDYTGTLSSGPALFIPGQSVAVVGVQPAAGAPLIASKVIVLQ
jgi:hypothetical protein